MPTIFDVAQAAGVGVGTVSRVLNDSPAVSDATRSKVQAVISDLDYRPSSLARGLSLGTTNIIGAVVPKVTRPSSMERLRGVLDELGGSGYDLALYQVDGEEQRSSRIRDIVRPDRCSAGLLISLRAAPDEILVMTQAKRPVVTIDGHIEGLPGCHIDNVAGGRMATEHLLRLGHRVIAFVGDIEDDLGFNPGAARFEGYQEALRGLGIARRDDLIKTGPHSRESADELTRGLFGASDPPTGIVATSDTQAFGVMAAVRSQGLEVPTDVSVVGFDDLELAGHLGLTTVRQPLYESGVLGARMLLQQLDGHRDGLDVVELPLEVVVRETTAPPSKGSALYGA
ncbi:MAG: LacI family DNA-binding transcriptional regulator [Acidimicrobiia bacterium]|nr:LacI family DNA-binding transcriptional regulator [Acidimicrobiia bacterium]